MDRLQALRDTANLPRAVAPSVYSTQQPECCLDDSGLDMRMDDSLTDMQWLQRMDAGSDFPGFANKVARKRMRGDKENQRGRAKDGCRKKLDYGTKPPSNKPPLSYASLIVLAICSTPQRMMTLSGIYRWIESTFPFYCTPESKAWKNSVRHNLSIRKNMFQKVYQYPPRRGNGSYWTLLSDGEEELKKAYPLFTTLLPPIIDESSVYCRAPSTHVVKSKGQFVPVLPHSTKREPYFALQREESPSSSNEISQSQEPGKGSSGKTLPTAWRSGQSKQATPKHLVEHSYAKSIPLHAVSELCEEELSPESMTNGSFLSDSGTEEPDWKRFCSTLSSGSPSQEDKELPPNLSSKPSPPSCKVSEGDKNVTSSALCTTPVRSPHDRDADCSLSLLDSSFLTPTKHTIPDMGLDNISLSPLYNFVTPQRGGTPQHNTSTTSHNSTTAPSSVDSAPPLPSLTPPTTTMCPGPPRSEADTFSPVMSSLHFSTPLMTGVSPVGDLPGNVFDTPRAQDSLTPLRTVDAANSLGTTCTPTRQSTNRNPFSLPGFTPPSATSAPSGNEASF